MFDFLQKYLMGPMGNRRFDVFGFEYFAITVPIFRRIF